jgi:hypothetical protein
MRIKEAGDEWGYKCRCGRTGSVAVKDYRRLRDYDLGLV